MLVIYQDFLFGGYLLALAPSRTARSEAGLAHSLRLAAQSGSAAVWLDCRLLDELSATAGRLLRRLHYCLGQRQAQLVLCNASERLVHGLYAAGAAPETGFVLVNSLDEAANYAPGSPTD